jgi:preprotein translocase subunit SecE
MAKDQGVNMPTAQRPRGGARPTAPAKPPSATAQPSAPKRRFNPAQLLTEVRAEARKITWTSWKETWLLSVMVFIMVVVTAVFFLVVDSALRLLITQLLRLTS